MGQFLINRGCFTNVCSWAIIPDSVDRRADAIYHWLVGGDKFWFAANDR